MERSFWVAVGVTVAAVSSGVLGLAFRLGLSGPLSFLLELGTVTAAAWAWAYHDPIERFFRRRIALSADRRSELLDRHRINYADRVVNPLSDYRGTHDRDEKFLGPSSAWSVLLLTYSPSSAVAHKSDLDSFALHIAHDLAPDSKALDQIREDAESIELDAQDWGSGLLDAVDRSYFGYEKQLGWAGPVEDTGQARAPGPYMDSNATARLIIEAWRKPAGLVELGIKLGDWPQEAQLFPFTGTEEEKSALEMKRWAEPYRYEVIVMGTANGGVLYGGQEIFRPPPGGSVADWRRITRNMVMDSTVFDEYASLLKRAHRVSHQILVVKSRFSEVDARIRRGDYSPIFPCCEQAMSPLAKDDTPVSR